LSERIYSLAKSKRAKVAIGLDVRLPSAERLVNSALFAKREGYAEPVLISSQKSDSDFDGVLGMELPLIVDAHPESSLVGMLKDGTVDAAVRGNLGSKLLIPLLRSEFSVPNLLRITVLEAGESIVMLGPVGIEEGDSAESLVSLAKSGKSLSKSLGIPFKVGILSGGRLEDRGRSQRVDRMLEESERIAFELTRAGIDAEEFGIEIERAIESGSTLVLAPDGITGNLIFRSLVLVANIESFGAYAAALPRTYVDTSRAKGGYLLPIILASALSGKPKSD
jgi:predicted methyltransferase MtxX (methanogen marker protein 4)